MSLEPKEGVVIYNTPHSPTFSFWLGNKLFKAKKGIVELTDEQDVILQEMISEGTRPDLVSNLKKIDFDKAFAIAKAHAKNTPPAAEKGGSTSVNATTQAIREQLILNQSDFANLSPEEKQQAVNEALNRQAADATGREPIPQDGKERPPIPQNSEPANSDGKPSLFAKKTS